MRIEIFLLGLLLLPAGMLQAAESQTTPAASTIEAKTEQEGLLWDRDGDGKMGAAERQDAWLKIREKRKSPFIPAQDAKEPLKPSKK